MRRRIKGRIEGKDTPPPLGWPTHGGDRGEGKDGEGGNSFFADNREMIYHHVVTYTPPALAERDNPGGKKDKIARAILPLEVPITVGP